MVGLALADVSKAESLLPSFRAVMVFGDSLSDTGNAARVTGIPRAPYFAGRFSDGPVWVEDVAAALGEKVKAFLEGGTNFAFGSATTADMLRLQVNIFLITHILGIDSDALYVVFGGGSDLRRVVGTYAAAVRQGTPPAVAKAEARAETITVARDLAQVVEVLFDAGAKTFLVPNLPDVSLIPETQVLDNGFPATADKPTVVAARLTRLFNAEVDNALAQLPRSRINIIRLNTQALLRAIINDPPAFGLANVTDACLTTARGAPADPLTRNPVICSSPGPEQFLFWDNQHPTRAAHQILAAAALEALRPCDADADGIVTRQDAQAVSRWLVFGEPLPGNGDCNQDGQVSWRDRSLIIEASK
jgi:outer membrane lipase/esterase